MANILDLGQPDPATSDPAAAQLMRRATTASVAVAALLIIVKLFAFLVTGSVALLSSLVDSVLDSLASLINFFAVRHALTPADREHRFGHGKAEPLAGLAQAAFITGSSVFIVIEAVDRLLHPVPIVRGTVGLAVMVLSLVLTLGLVQYQRYVLKRTRSVAIRADSLHYVSDIAMNLSVIAALVLSVHFGWWAADPLFALGISIYIIYSVGQIATAAIDQLMDRELPDGDRERIEAICLSHPHVIDLHALRTRASGKDVFIQLHLVLDSTMSLHDAHRVVEDVDAALQDAFPGADIIIHEDPDTEHVPDRA